jgi:hypothetical protein
MIIDRTLWNAEFTAHALPRWPCAACQSGRLQIRKDSLQEGQTAASRAQFGHDAWEPEWIDGRFACLLECVECGNAVAVAGRYRVQDDRYYDEQQGEGGDFEKYYRPSYFSESPPLILLPPSLTSHVAEEIRSSFQHFWGDPSAAANRIRSAVEKLLTDQRIPRTTGRVPGKRRRFLNLHERIERFGMVRSDLAKKLMAIKWIGNAGSHSAAINAEDLLDGYELLSFVLDELYSGRRRRVEAITSSIIRRKAPRSPRRAS